MIGADMHFFKFFEAPKFKFIVRNLGLSSAFATVGFSLFSNTIADIFYVLSLVCWLFNGRFYSVRHPFLNIVWLLHLALYIFEQKAQINSGAFWGIFKSDFKRYSCWFIYSGLLESASVKDRRLAVGVLNLTTLLLCLLVLLQIVHLVPLQCALLPDSRCYEGAVGILNPFFSSIILLLSFFINLSFIEKLLKLKSWSWLKVFSILSLALQFFAVLLLGQRSCSIALLAGILLWSILVIRKFGFKPLIVAFGGALVSFASAFALSHQLRVKLLKLAKMNDPAGLGCRMTVWRLNWNTFKAHPLLGNGKAVEFNCLGDHLNHAHNLYLQQLVSSGLLGFGLWLSFMTQAFLKIIFKKNNAAFVAGFVVLLLVGLLDDWFVHANLLRAFLLFLSLGL